MNLSFSTALTPVQTVIDHTSMKAFKTCPRYYFYRIVEGWVSKEESPHLVFGQHFHTGREVYEKSKAKGNGHELALRDAIKSVMKATWNYKLNRPWWSGHNEKNRFNLIRSLVWYLDDYGRNDPLQTIILRNGKPAVEQSFKFVAYNPLNGDILTSKITGEQIMIAGHFDRVAMQGDYPYVCDAKTTKNQLNEKFWAQFDPDNQVSLYTYAGRCGLMNVDDPGWETKSLLPMQHEIQGVIIDGIEVKVSFSRFDRREILRDNYQLEEWFRDFQYNVNLMGQMAEANYWPQNDSACGNYGGCPYRSVCSKTPGARKQQLEAFYTHEIWDPMIPRE
jgi:hypothetical protein